MSNNILNNLVNMILQANPNIKENQQASSWLNVIQNGDSTQGQQIADNICKSYGMSREEMLEQAKKFFNIQ